MGHHIFYSRHEWQTFFLGDFLLTAQQKSPKFINAIPALCLKPSAPQITLLGLLIAKRQAPLIAKRQSSAIFLATR